MDDDSLVDDVRAAIEPDAESVERVLRVARRPDGRRGSAGRRLAATVGAALLLSGALLVLTRATRQPAPASTRVTNVGDTIVVWPSSGSAWLIGARGAHADQLPSGTIIVYRTGDRR